MHEPLARALGGTGTKPDAPAVASPSMVSWISPRLGAWRTTSWVIAAGRVVYRRRHLPATGPGTADAGRGFGEDPDVVARFCVCDDG